MGEAKAVTFRDARLFQLAIFGFAELVLSEG